MSTPVQAATELVDVAPGVVVYDGQPMPLDTGSLLLHAVPSDDELTAVCGTAMRRLLPTGHAWRDCPLETPRCSACLAAHPLDRE